jgi:ferredoxin
VQRHGLLPGASSGTVRAEDRRAWLREDFDLATADRDDVEEAAAACPWFAITVEEQ